MTTDATCTALVYPGARACGRPAAKIVVMHVFVRTQIVESPRCTRHAAMDVRRDAGLPHLITEVRDLAR